MKEKINVNVDLDSRWMSGYFKPSGKYEKRAIHKMIRRIKDLDTNKKGIYNRIGVIWNWS